MNPPWSFFACGGGMPLLVAALLLPAAVNAALVKAVEFVGDHVLLTVHPEEIAALDSGRIPGWTRSGLELWVHDAPAPGLVPVCRFYSARFAAGTAHFLTAFDEECQALKHDPAWSYEGIAFYAALPSPFEDEMTCRGGTSRIFRWYNNGQGGVHRHAFTPYARSRSPANVLSLGGYGEIGWVSEGMGYRAWTPTDYDWWKSDFQDGIAFCSVVTSLGEGFDRAKAEAGVLALVAGTRWTLRSSERGAISVEFANEIAYQDRLGYLLVKAGNRVGTVGWIQSNGPLAVTLEPPLGSLTEAFQTLYLTFIGRNVIEGCLYDQWRTGGFNVCERVVATRQ